MFIKSNIWEFKRTLIVPIANHTPCEPKHWHQAINRTVQVVSVCMSQYFNYSLHPNKQKTSHAAWDSMGQNGFYMGQHHSVLHGTAWVLHGTDGVYMGQHVFFMGQDTWDSICF